MQSEYPANQPGETVAYVPDLEAERSGWRSHRTRLIILAGVIALAVAYMVYAAFPGNTLYFVTVSEFLDDPKLQDGQTLRVAGALAADTFRRDDGSTLSHFALGDKLPDVPGASPGSPRLQASYVGVLPDLFFNPHSEIILEGRYDGQGQVFATDNILVKSIQVPVHAGGKPRIDPRRSCPRRLLIVMERPDYV